MNPVEHILRVLIVDDEKFARQYLRKLLDQRPDFEIVGECRNAREALQMIGQESPDLVLLDIQMPGMSGLKLVEKVGVDKMPVTVFITAYDEYAIKAFELHAVGYLLKPFTPRRFWETINRARGFIVNRRQSTKFREMLALLLAQAGKPPTERRPEGEPSATSRPGKSIDSSDFLTRIVVHGPTRSHVVAVREIGWLSAADCYVEIHVGAQTHLIRESLDSFEKCLNPSDFMRVHRSTIVNLHSINAIEKTVSGQSNVVLKSGVRIKVSRRKRRALADMLGAKIRR